MNILILLTALTVVFILTFLLGYLMLRATTKLNEVECLAFSGLVGVTIEAIIAFVAFLGGLFSPWFYFGMFVFLIIASARVAWQQNRLIPHNRPPRQWLMGAVALWVMLVTTQCLVSVYTGSGWYGDWWMHFDIALFYLGERPVDITYFNQYTLFSRTPLFNWVQSFFMGALDLGQPFAVYQLTALIPNIVFIPIFLLLVGRQKIEIALFVIVFNPFLMRNSLYPWPKLLATAYVLAALYFYLQANQAVTPLLNKGNPSSNRPTHNKPTPLITKHLLAWGLFMGLAILTHPSTLLYGAAMGVAWLWLTKKQLKNYLKPLLGASLATLGVLLPWLLWGMSVAGASVFLTNPTVSGASTDSSFLMWLVARLWNTVVTLIPHALCTSILQSGFSTFDFGQFGGLDPLWFYYYNVLPGAITTILTVQLLIAIGKYRLTNKIPTWAIIITIFAFGGGILLQPGLVQNGVAPESMAPLVLMALIFVSRALYIARPNTRRTIFIILIIEFLISRGIHIALLIFNRIPSDDGNLLLKLQEQLIFSRDLIASAWPIFVIVLGMAYAVIIWLGMTQDNKRKYKNA